MTREEAARLIDISAVRACHTESDVRECVSVAKEYGFINVHSLPTYTALVAELLASAPDIYVGAPVGFPGGGHRTETKLREAELLARDGVQEMDIVMNVGRFKDGDYHYVLDELNRVIAHVPDSITKKVIIEINVLTDDEMLRAAELVIDSGADFLKTGTGWVPGGANVERIGKLKAVTGNDVKIKAAGGIRSRYEFDALLEMNVERFGINTESAMEIVQSFEVGM
ncbi:MAG: deoxyribose-phosphate aldolase [Clostridiales Family XIII bacterium]|jgi:deoxyribose-phosphate aldolase|nr:deoxyribose-phosphate aldolase [Clostridiales Family XIII bacterium]